MQRLKAPFPYFGGKSFVANIVWERFGDTPNYVEPFFGSGAVLLARPHWPWKGQERVETVNDKNGFISNFWRAVKDAPDAVAKYADWPINEIDLNSRHVWLVSQSENLSAKLLEDPDYYDTKIAGWWLWGICSWLGSGFCADSIKKQRPALGSKGRGVHRTSMKKPALSDKGHGVHRTSMKRPALSDKGMGIHRTVIPDKYLIGDICENRRMYIERMLRVLSDRLRRVRVCCGDWSRVCTPIVTRHLGLTAVFLDPPYSGEAGRTKDLYSTDSNSVAQDVAFWAREQGKDPKFRIALCGYEGEHDMPDDWECVKWKAKGGYCNTGNNEQTKENRNRERIWFSPYCLKKTKSLQQQKFF